LVAAVQCGSGAADDVVLGVGGEPLDDRSEVSHFLGSVMAVD
jgi:hypothetical protein